MRPACMASVIPCSCLSQRETPIFSDDSLLRKIPVQFWSHLTPYREATEDGVP